MLGALSPTLAFGHLTGLNNELYVIWKESFDVDEKTLKFLSERCASVQCYRGQSSSLHFISVYISSDIFLSCSKAGFIVVCSILI